MNWGEPWYAGFRESQTEYRLKNQEYFQRNLMPAMLGWFSMRTNTSIEDVEWMLARSAAFDAGYDFVVREEALQANGQVDQIFQQISDWEKLRLAGAFSEEQKERMKDINNEFHLEAVSENSWNFHQIFVQRINHKKKVRQPGEPLYSQLEFTKPIENSTLQLIMTAEDATIKDIRLELNNYAELTLPITLKKGQSIRIQEGGRVLILDDNLRVINTLNIESSSLLLKRGDQLLSVDCSFENAGENPTLKVETRIMGEAELISKK